MNTFLIAVTLLSIGFAAVMGVVAWRATREEQRRSDARVATLEAAIIDDQVPATSSEMFAITRVERERSPLPLALAVAATIVFGVVGAIGVLRGRAESTETQKAPVVAARHEAPLLAAPIELVSLGHAREADGLVVRGVVRNPSNGLERDHLTAVVLLYNADGSFAATGRAEVTRTALEPGDETTFAVSVPAGSRVGRYRVSFRNDNDQVVPHVDKRHGA